MKHLRQSFSVSERHACELVGVAVSSFRYRCRRDDERLRENLVALAREKPRFGYRRLHVLLRRQGETVNHKRVWRVYREAGLCVKRRRRKRLSRTCVPQLPAAHANHRWSLDFASGDWPPHSSARCDRHLHARVSGAGSRHELPKWSRDAGA